MYSGQYGSGAEVAQRINEDDACDECGSGKYSKAKGADSVETCIDCQPGKKATDVVAATEETTATDNVVCQIKICISVVAAFQLIRHAAT